MSSEALKKKRTGMPAMTVERFIYELGNHELLAPGCEELASGGWEVDELNEMFGRFFAKFKIECKIHFELRSGDEKRLSGKWRLEGADSATTLTRARGKEMFENIVTELNGYADIGFSDFAEYYSFTASPQKKEAPPTPKAATAHSEQCGNGANSTAVDENAKKEHPNGDDPTPTPKPTDDLGV